MSNEITWDDVKAQAKAIAAQLALFTPTEQEIVLVEAYMRVPDIYGCPLTKILRGLYAAHIASQQMSEVAGEGALTSETIGTVSFNKNQPVNNPQAHEELYETIYGRRYSHLLEEFGKRNVIAFGVYSNGALTGFPRIIKEC